MITCSRGNLKIKLPNLFFCFCYTFCLLIFVVPKDLKNSEKSKKGLVFTILLSTAFQLSVFAEYLQYYMPNWAGPLHNALIFSQFEQFSIFTFLLKLSLFLERDFSYITLDNICIVCDFL